jgi:hypothetical protein
MSSTRANLDDLGHNSTYIVLTVVLIILSIVGVYLFFQLKKTDSFNEIVIPGVSPSPTISSQLSPSIEPILSIEPTVSPLPQVQTPTPTIKEFTSDADGFNVSYMSDRTLYQDKERSGNRYTFYSPQGNIAVHAGPSWSWIYPDRQFSQSFLVSGYPTFIYDIDTQTIVDFQVGSKLYTIQCVHNGTPGLKAECQQFLQDLKLN